MQGPPTAKEEHRNQNQGGGVGGMLKAVPAKQEDKRNKNNIISMCSKNHHESSRHFSFFFNKDTPQGVCSRAFSVLTTMLPYTTRKQGTKVTSDLLNQILWSLKEKCVRRKQKQPYVDVEHKPSIILSLGHWWSNTEEIFYHPLAFISFSLIILFQTTSAERSVA